MTVPQPTAAEDLAQSFREALADYADQHDIDAIVAAAHERHGQDVRSVDQLRDWYGLAEEFPVGGRWARPGGASV